jgi:hypothetical protein
MRLIIAGSRTFSNYNMLKTSILTNYSLESLEIISGGARGADSLGERFAHEHSLKIHRYPAQWDKYGKSAGYRRNEQMALNADACIVFWDGTSRGTQHMINLCEKHGLPCVVVRF